MSSELTESKDNKIFFHNTELASIGCKNCIWKLHGQCPYNLKNDEEYVPFTDGFDGSEPAILDATSVGICPDMVKFLSTLTEEGDTSSNIWEKYHIYKARLQEAEDYKDYIQLQEKIKKLELVPARSEEEVEQRKELKYDRNAAKLWWARLNEHVVRSLQKVNDRAVKKEVPKSAGIYSAKTINFNVVKQLEEK